MSHKYRIGPMRPRLATTFALAPGVAALMIVVAFVADRFDGGGASSRVVWGVAAVSPGLLSYLGVGVVWAGGVDWNARRRTRVALTTAAYVCSLPCVAALLFLSNAAGQITTFTLLATSLAGCAAAMIVASCICWEPRRADSGAPCPKCGYDLRGQHECRCPECGEQFTVGELVGRASDDAS